MFLGAKKHILSNVLLISALISIAAGLLSLLSRLLIKVPMFDPVMTNGTIWFISGALSVLQIILTAVVFIHHWKMIVRLINLVPEEERKQMGQLQEEYLGKRLPSLTAEEVKKLLEIWGVILIGAQSVYQISSGLYRRFIEELSLVMMGNITAFTMIYNSTHGFKYLGMMIAIILGILITAIFLNDRTLKISSLILSLGFLVLFGMMGMQTLTVFGHYIGIVWTSILFHLVDMVGLILLAFYLRRRYSGV